MKGGGPPEPVHPSNLNGAESGSVQKGSLVQGGGVGYASVVGPSGITGQKRSKATTGPPPVFWAQGEKSRVTLDIREVSGRNATNKEKKNDQDNRCPGNASRILTQTKRRRKGGR